MWEAHVSALAAANGVRGHVKITTTEEIGSQIPSPVTFNEVVSILGLEMGPVARTKPGKRK